MVEWHWVAAAFALGVIFGLVFGPDSEREYRAKVDGWLSGYKFAKDSTTSPASSTTGEG